MTLDDPSPTPPQWQTATSSTAIPAAGAVVSESTQVITSLRLRRVPLVRNSDDPGGVCTPGDHVPSTVQADQKLESTWVLASQSSTRGQLDLIFPTSWLDVSAPVLGSKPRQLQHLATPHRGRRTPTKSVISPCLKPWTGKIPS